jgi:hypothetical protein
VLRHRIIPVLLVTLHIDCCIFPSEVDGSRTYIEAFRWATVSRIAKFKISTSVMMAV